MVYHNTAVGLCILVMISLAIGVNGISSDPDGISQEFCQLETFNPQCLKNEVIVIEKASYGRHRVGKCITAKESSFSTDVQYFGCYANVASQMNAKCSGKRQCEVRIPDADLEQTRSCLPGLQMFLEVTYHCLEVVELERSCNVPVTSRRLHLSGGQSNTGLQCGTRTQPWLLEAPAGQRINLTVVDFRQRIPDTEMTVHLGSRSQVHPPVSSSTNDKCSSRHTHQYGYVIDKSATNSDQKNVSICAAVAGSESSSAVYISTSNAIELVLVDRSTERVTPGDQSFIISFTAVGCTNLVPPNDAWVKRDHENIIIGCYTSRQTWQLRCQDGRWIGVVSNCNETMHAEAGESKAIRKNATSILDNYEVAAVVAIGFGCLAICLTIVCCGVVCLYKFYTFTDANKSDKYGFVEQHKTIANNGFQLLTAGQQVRLTANDNCQLQFTSTQHSEA